MNIPAAEIWLLAMSAAIAAALVIASISKARSRRERKAATCCEHCTDTTTRLRNAGLPAQRTFHPGGTR